MNRAAKGNAKELKTAALLATEGWVVASRRHIAGPGDLLAVKQGERPRLIEVKCAASAYTNFRRPDRDDLRTYAQRHGLVAELAWWKPRAREHQIIDEARWPDS